MLVKRLVACEHCGHGFDAVDADSIVCEKKERILSRRPRRCLTRDVRCFLAFQTDVHQRLVHAQRARQRRGAVVANSVICQKSNVLITCASKRRRQTARTSLKSSFVSVVLLLSATASAWAPSSPRRFTVQGPRSVLRRGRRTAAKRRACRSSRHPPAPCGAAARPTAL